MNEAREVLKSMREKIAEQAVGDVLDMKVPPQNVEAEVAIIGAILIDNDALKQVEHLMNADDFYRGANARIFKTMQKLRKSDQPIDVITLTDALEKGGDLEACGGVSYLHSVITQTATSANAGYHAKMVAEHSKLRKLITACRTGMEMAYRQDSIDTCLAVLRSATAGIVTAQGGDIVTMEEIARSTMEFVDRRMAHRHELSGLETGFQRLDDLTDGLQGGDQIILAGRPGTGKTSFAMDIVERVAKRGQPAGVISIEMGRHPIGIRTLSTLSHVDMLKIRKGWLHDGDDYRKIVLAANKMAELPIYFAFSARDTSELERTVTKMVELYGIKLLVIDYLQLLRNPNIQKREREVADISWLCKVMATTHNIPVLALSQLNRGIENRDNARPQLSDLRESGAIEQDADVVIFIHKQKNADKNCEVEVIIGKGRNIGLDTMKLWFRGDTVSFHNIRREQLEDGSWVETPDFES